MNEPKPLSAGRFKKRRLVAMSGAAQAAKSAKPVSLPKLRCLENKDGEDADQVAR